MKNNIVVIRKIKNITQQELVGRIGVKRQFVSKIERGEVLPSLKLAFRIAEELGVCICTLFNHE